jgi:hypothetical protein
MARGEAGEAAMSAWVEANLLHKHTPECTARGCVEVWEADELDRLRRELAEAHGVISGLRFELEGAEHMRLRDNKYLIDQRDTARRELAEARGLMYEWQQFGIRVGAPVILAGLADAFLTPSPPAAAHDPSSPPPE